MELESIIGITAGICTSVASIPQIATTIKKKKAADVSPVMFAVLLAGNALWAFYGILKTDVPIMATNSLSVLLDLVMLFLRFKYRNGQNK
jgi:MtN3 and saliva related transmembrane protein